MALIYGRNGLSPRRCDVGEQRARIPMGRGLRQQIPPSPECCVADEDTDGVKILAEM